VRRVAPVHAEDVQAAEFVKEPNETREGEPRNVTPLTRFASVRLAVLGPRDPANFGSASHVFGLRGRVRARRVPEVRPSRRGVRGRSRRKEVPRAEDARRRKGIVRQTRRGVVREAQEETREEFPEGRAGLPRGRELALTGDGRRQTARAFRDL
jgi:hypothetical protein